MTRLLVFIFACCACLPATAADTPVTHAPAETVVPGWLDITPTPYGPMLIQQGPPPPYRDYQMSRVLTPEERKRWLEMSMPMMANVMQMDAREVMNHFAVKLKAKSGLSFDEVIQSMMLRANRLNLKFVGSNPISQDLRAALNDDTVPRTEIFSFCDIMLARDLLRHIPEMVVFMPCRIAVMADAAGDIWILTMNWDVTGLELAGKQENIPPELRRGMLDIRNKMEDVMRAGANGEL
jgi:uncharacterized protein (DUF302 family)